MRNDEEPKASAFRIFEGQHDWCVLSSRTDDALEHLT